MATLTGINIQYPISQLILNGKKTVETRTYPIPKKFVGVELAFIETPGSSGGFEARIVGTIKFESCFKYKNKKDFYNDTNKHCVTEDTPWRWDNKKPKWGWKISSVKLFKQPMRAPTKKGIVYTKDIHI